MTVRFEDVVRAPVDELTRVLAAAGLEFEVDVLDVARMSSSVAGDRPGTGVDPDRVGSWRKGLSRAEVWLCERVTKAERARHGYAGTSSGRPPASVASQLLTLPLKGALSVAANARRASDVRTAAARRIRALTAGAG